MRGDRLGNDLDVHAGERLRCIDEPLHFSFLRRAVEARHVADLRVEELLCLIHAGKGGAGHCQQHGRSEEHTSELQSLMRISYAVFCLKKKTYKDKIHKQTSTHTPYRT